MLVIVGVPDLHMITIQGDDALLREQVEDEVARVQIIQISTASFLGKLSRRAVWESRNGTDVLHW